MSKSTKIKGVTNIEENGVVQWDIVKEAGFHAFEVPYIVGVNSISAIALNPREQHLVTLLDKKLIYLDGIDWPVPVRYTISGDMENVIVMDNKTNYQPETIPVIYSGLVCIDGPDASGKTTLANKIAEMTNGEVIHLTWTPRLAEVMNSYRCSAIEYAAALAHDKVVILERPWLCHVAYSMVYREGQYKYHDVMRWKQLCEEHEVLSIMALPSEPKTAVSLYLKMCSEREELHGPDGQKMLEVHEIFRNTTLVPSPFQPGTQPHANFEVYDYQAFPSMVGDFVVRSVLPHLNTRS